MNVTDLILVIGYFIGVAGSAVFVVKFWFAKWWLYPEGRAIMGLHTVLTYFGVLTVLRLVYGADYPGRAILAIIGVYSFVAAVWACTFLLFQAQRRVKQAAVARVEDAQRVVVEGDHQTVTIEGSDDATP